MRASSRAPHVAVFHDLQELGLDGETLVLVYFVPLQAQPAPHWQVLVQSQRSPQTQRSVVAFAHPHDAVSHRHSFWVSFVIESLL
jgi:hypothetical protein